MTAFSHLTPGTSYQKAVNTKGKIQISKEYPVYPPKMLKSLIIQKGLLFSELARQLIVCIFNNLCGFGLILKLL